MKTYIEENCPLCDQNSKYYVVDHGDKKYFNVLRAENSKSQ